MMRKHENLEKIDAKTRKLAWCVKGLSMFFCTLHSVLFQFFSTNKLFCKVFHYFGESFRCTSMTCRWRQRFWSASNRRANRSRLSQSTATSQGCSNCSFRSVQLSFLSVSSSNWAPVDYFCCQCGAVLPDCCCQCVAVLPDCCRDPLNSWIRWLVCSRDFCKIEN